MIRRRSLLAYGRLAAAGAVGWLAVPALAATSAHNSRWMIETYFVLAVIITIAATHTRRFGQAWTIGATVVAPAIVLAGWTTPRGDNDGLWILIFPMLGVLLGGCVGVAVGYDAFLRRRA